jgi:hypothetical protein
LAFPEELPVTGFRLKNKLSIYSGGTVRESNPIILFSKYGHTPYPPRSWYSVVGNIVTPHPGDVNSK